MWMTTGLQNPGPEESAVSDPLENGTQEHPFDAIQQGIDATATGNTVLVADGPIRGPATEISTFGQGDHCPSASEPVIALLIAKGVRGSHLAFVLDENEGRLSVLQGFTIINGYSSGQGGAIRCSSASPSILACVFRNNKANYGSVIYIENGGPELPIVRSRNQSLWEGADVMNRSDSSNTLVRPLEFRENILGGFSNQYERMPV